MILAQRIDECHSLSSSGIEPLVEPHGSLCGSNAAPPDTRQVGSACERPVRGTCTFYRECLEAKYHCGEQGYPLGYGEHYCETFKVKRDLLSPAGQKWMVDTMQCLQETLVHEGAMDVLHVGDGDCGLLKDIAFDSHSRCYVSSGLCELHTRDWVAILRIVEIKTLFGSVAALKETLQSTARCGSLWWHLSLLT